MVVLLREAYNKNKPKPLSKTAVLKREFMVLSRVKI